MTATDDRAVRGRRRRWARFARTWGFLVFVTALYGVLLLVVSGRALAALEASGRILLQVALPLCVAFVVMFLLNLLVKPAHVSRLAGRGAGIKGVCLSTAAGVLSMGPIYAWYPLLKSLRDKGASDFHLANFLSNRAVKPFLLPLMVFYFGWVFTLALTVLTVLGALVVAAVVGLVAGRLRPHRSDAPAQTAGGRRPGSREET
jgi:uncharacterized membrane protein YraQ (UPF0718 family)